MASSLRNTPTTSVRRLISRHSPEPYFTAFYPDQERRRYLRLYAEISGSDSYDLNFRPRTLDARTD
jgi:hypothetical protein